MFEEEAKKKVVTGTARSTANAGLKPNRISPNWLLGSYASSDLNYATVARNIFNREDGVEISHAIEKRGLENSDFSHDET